MSDGMAVPQGGWRKHRKRILGGGATAVDRRRGLRVRAAADRRLSRRLGGDQGPELAGRPSAPRSDGAEHRDVSPELDGGATGSRLPPGPGHDAGVDCALDGDTGRCRGGNGRLVHDASRLGLRRRADDPGRGCHRRLEPVRESRVPHRRARAPDRSRRGQSGASHVGSHRPRRPHHRDRRLRARALERRARSLDRQPRGTADESSVAPRAPRPRDVGRRGARAVPLRARWSSCADAGMSSPRQHWSGTSPSSCSLSCACVSSGLPVGRCPGSRRSPLGR